MVTPFLLVTFLLVTFICSFVTVEGSLLRHHGGDNGGGDVGNICASQPRPHFQDKAKMARWMVHTLDWGILSTISTRPIAGRGRQNDGENISVDVGDNEASPVAVPFGNIYSFVDGPCDTSSGTPYFYTSDLDQSMKDTHEHPTVSFTLTEASLAGASSRCSISEKGFGDPMNPPCARLVVTGEFVHVKNADEVERAISALFKRHPAMSKWPSDHTWYVAKIVVKDLWLIDIFGGASIINVDEYFNVEFTEEMNDGERRERITENKNDNIAPLIGEVLQFHKHFAW